MSVLAIDHRPKSFADVEGQAHVRAVLRAMVAQQDVPPALLFSGNRGVGKTSCARIFAAALNCLEPNEGDACGRCSQCVSVQIGSSVSVIEVDAASTGGVEDIRKIREHTRVSHPGRYRVIILDEAQSLTREANNAALKILEEPPANTVFILVTTEPHKILDTVRSRAMPFDFRRIRTQDVVARLKRIAERESLGMEEGLLNRIAVAAEGGLRDAVMLMDQARRVRITTEEAFVEFYGYQNYAPGILWAAIQGDHAQAHRLISESFSRTGDLSRIITDLSRLTADLLILHSNGHLPYSESELSERSQLAESLSVESITRVVELLWNLRQDPISGDSFSSLEMAIFLVVEAVKSNRPVQPQPILTRTESRVESLDEMSTM